MKRVLAMIMSMVLVAAVLAVPVGAATPKFYIPQRITEQIINDTNDCSLSYDPQKRELDVSVKGTSNESLYDGTASWLPMSLQDFLINESTDILSNRFIEYDLNDEIGAFFECPFFANDMIRYGKIKRIVCDYDSQMKVVWENITQNSRLTSAKLSVEDEDPVTFNFHFEYNKDGTISKITRDGYDQLNGHYKRIVKFHYDSKKRPSSYTVDEGDKIYYKVTLSHYDSKGLPQRHDSEIHDSMGIGSSSIQQYFSYNDKNQITKVRTDYDYNASLSYDAQGRLSMISTNREETYTYSNFMNL